MRGIAACGMCARCTAHRCITFSLRARLSRLTVSHVPGPRTEVRAGVVLDVAFGVCETESGKLYLDFHIYLLSRVSVVQSESLYTIETDVLRSVSRRVQDESFVTST